MDEQFRIWSTDVVDASQRFDYWVGAICECFLEMEADTPARAGFSASLRSMPLRDLRINRVCGSSQHVHRTRQSIARGRHNFYYLLCKESTPCCITQSGGSTARLLPGDLTLIDSRRPYELQFPQAVDIYSLQLPIEWLDTWLPDAGSLLGRRIDGNSGWGHVLGAYVRQLAVAPGALPSAVQVDHLGGVIAMALGAPRDDPHSTSRDLAPRIEDCIRSRFAEPGLTASDVAESLGVCVRTVHRALSAERRTFAQSLTQCRMAAAQRMLASRAFDRLTTAEIGRRVGFLEPSHFTRLYRRTTGTTPAKARRDP